MTGSFLPWQGMMGLLAMVYLLELLLRILLRWKNLMLVPPRFWKNRLPKKMRPRTNQQMMSIPLLVDPVKMMKLMMGPAMGWVVKKVMLPFQRIWRFRKSLQPEPLQPRRDQPPSNLVGRTDQWIRAINGTNAHSHSIRWDSLDRKPIRFPGRYGQWSPYGVVQSWNGTDVTLNYSICGLFAFSHFGGLNIGKLHITKAWSHEPWALAWQSIGSFDTAFPEEGRILVMNPVYPCTNSIFIEHKQLFSRPLHHPAMLRIRILQVQVLPRMVKPWVLRFPSPGCNFHPWEKDTPREWKQFSPDSGYLHGWVPGQPWGQSFLGEKINAIGNKI